MRKLNSPARLVASIALGLGLASGANAANIVLNNTGGVEVGTQAYMGFTKAAAFWSSVLTNDVTIKLDVGYASLGAGILGSTGSTRVSVYTSGAEYLLNANKSSALDNIAVANMPTLDANGALSVITSGYKNAVTKAGVNTATRVLDNDGSANNFVLSITQANAKALGFTGLGTGADASITFSSNFAFDFDPTDGIGAGKYDFLGIAIHEIGHALGFVSGVDTYDAYGGPNGPSKASNLNLNNYAINSVLDLFRYSSDPNNLAPGGPYLDWSVGGNPYFSLDRGNSVFTLNGEAGYFSTGAYNGNGNQASHWKDNTYAGGANCSNPVTAPVGILDPTAGRCESMTVTALDLAAFDVMGWNIAYDVLANPDWHASTADIFVGDFDGVPEPATWALLTLGFAGLGASSRKRRSAGH